MKIHPPSKSAMRQSATSKPAPFSGKNSMASLPSFFVFLYVYFCHIASNRCCYSLVAGKGCVSFPGIAPFGCADASRRLLT